MVAYHQLEDYTQGFFCDRTSKMCLRKLTQISVFCGLQHSELCKEIDESVKLRSQDCNIFDASGGSKCSRSNILYSLSSSFVVFVL